MPKSSPEETFAKCFNVANDPAAPQSMRDEAQRAMAAWLKRHGKTTRDIQAILVKAAEDERVRNPPPPPPDPRDSAPNPFDLKRFDPASLVEGSLKQYVTMSEPVSVIASLWVPFSWVYTQFSIAPRVALVSKWPESGKSTLRKVMQRHLLCRPNREVLGTSATLKRFIDRGPCSIALDEVDFLPAEARQNLQLLWNLGHERDAEISLMIGGKPMFLKLYAPMLAAGLGGFLGGLLTPTQLSRTFLLELEQCPEAPRPRDYNLGPDNPEAGITNGIDVMALEAVRAFLRDWAPRVRLNLNPPLPPGMIGRFGDNARGLLSVAHSCGPQWVKRAHDVFAGLLEREKAARPWVLILRHALALAEVLELERIPSVRLNKELLRLDLPEARWNQYRGPSGGECVHPLRLDEQATLFGMSGIEAKPMRPLGGGKLFRGYECSWFVEALRKYETATPDDTEPGRGRLRLITPALGFGLASSSLILATALSQVPGPVVGAGLPGLVLVCGALLALARRRRSQYALAGG